MDFYKFWSQFKKDADPEKLIKAVREVQQRAKDASAEAQAAEAAYFADVKKREEKIAARIATLNERRSAIETEYSALKYPLTTAMANEDSKELGKIRSQMKALEEEKDRTENEVELLQSAYIRGDDDLYAVVKAKNERYLELKKAAQEVMRTVHQYDFEKRYEAVTSCCYYWHDYHIGTTLGSGADMQLINKNYNAEVNTKRALDESKRIAEEVDRRQVQGRVKITHHINSDSDIRANPGYNPDNYERATEDAGSSEDLRFVEPWLNNSGNGGDVRRAGRDRPARNDASSAALSTEENGLLKRAAARAQTLFRRYSP